MQQFKKKFFTSFNRMLHFSWLCLSIFLMGANMDTCGQDKEDIDSDDFIEEESSQTPASGLNHSKKLRKKKRRALYKRITIHPKARRSKVVKKKTSAVTKTMGALQSACGKCNQKFTGKEQELLSLSCSCGYAYHIPCIQELKIDNQPGFRKCPRCTTQCRMVHIVDGTYVEESDLDQSAIQASEEKAPLSLLASALQADNFHTECAICYESFLDEDKGKDNKGKGNLVWKLDCNCKQVYHGDCIKGWIKERNPGIGGIGICPMGRCTSPKITSLSMENGVLTYSTPKTLDEAGMVMQIPVAPNTPRTVPRQPVDEQAIREGEKRLQAEVNDVVLSVLKYRNFSTFHSVYTDPVVNLVIILKSIYPVIVKYHDPALIASTAAYIRSMASQEASYKQLIQDFRLDRIGPYMVSDWVRVCGEVQDMVQRNQYNGVSSSSTSDTIQFANEQINAFIQTLSPSDRKGYRGQILEELLKTSEKFICRYSKLILLSHIEHTLQVPDEIFDQVVAFHFRFRYWYNLCSKLSELRKSSKVS